MLDFEFRVPRLPLLSDRDRFLVDAARGKTVLHLGCVDSGLTEEAFNRGSLLHSKLAAVARRTYGVDIDTSGLQLLRDRGYADIEERSVYDLASGHWPDLDLIIAGEILEHVGSSEDFLCALRSTLATHPSAACLLSVPNAFHLRNVVSILTRNVELVHPDHNCYFSLRNLLTIAGKCGLHITAVWMYSNVGRQTPMKRISKRLLNRTLLAWRPYLAEGIVCRLELPRADS